MEDSVFYSGPSFNVVSDNVGLVTRKENYAKQVLSISSLVSYWRLGDYAQAQNYSQMVIADKPIGYWRFDEASGQTAIDRVGRVPATLTGTTRNVAGGIADGTTATTFNGTTDWGSIPINFQPQKIVTVEFWANVVAFAALDKMFMEYTTDANTLDGFWVDSGDGSSRININWHDVVSGNSLTLAVTPQPSAAAWHHYVFTFDRSTPASATITGYIDGVSKGNATGSFASTGSFANSLLYLASRSGSGLFLNYTLDELVIYNYILTPAQIMKHYATGVGKYAMTVLGDTPMAYWRLDDTGTTAQDYSATGGWSGTIQGTVTKGVAGATIETDTAMLFNGTTGQITVTPVAPPLTAFTFEAWVNHNGVAWAATYELILMNFTNPPGNANYMAVANGVYIGSTSITIGQLTASGGAIPTSGWHHMVMTWDGCFNRVYVDGIQTGVNSSCFLTLPPLVGYQIGGHGSEFFNGTIDEAAVYGYALTAQQVAQHYAAGLGKYTDSKGGFHGTPAGGVLVPGNKGALPSDSTSSLKFDGTNALATSLTLGAVTNYTLEAWVFKIGTVGTGNPRIFNWTSDGLDLGFLNGTATLAFFANGRTNAIWQSIGTVPLNQWTHCVVTYDGTTFLGYINGALKSTYTAQTGGALTASTALGINLIGEANQGRYQELAHYSVTLSPQQILANYNTGVSSPGRLIDIYGA